MALTEDLTFKLGDTGVILNTDSASFPFVDIEDVKGLDSAPFRETQRDHEGDDGGYMDAEFEKGRDVVLSGMLYSLSTPFESYMDTLKANWAPSTTQVPFYFKSPGTTERFLYVKPLGVRYNWTSLRRTGMAEVQFSAFAEDPRIYDSALVTAIMYLGATVYTGFGFNLGFSFGFGGVSTTTDQVIVNNPGNRPTPPIMTINGPVTNPRIFNETQGKEMQFNITLATGETLVIDTKNKTVKLNGTTNRRNTLIAPTWFYLNGGATQLRYRAESSDPTSFLTIEFRPAWR
jgi:hypothetical protein